MSRLRLETSVTPTVTLITLRGDLDVRGATLLDPEISRLARVDGPPVVLLDLREVSFLDSSGLRSVLLADVRLRRSGRELALVRGPETVHRVFAITRMHERLRFVSDPAELDGSTPA